MMRAPVKWADWQASTGAKVVRGRARSAKNAFKHGLSLSVESYPTLAADVDELARAIADRLRNGFVREPHVAIEVETYRPFFILGEVLAPGQYPYVPNMTVETAIAIAGGFTPRAFRYDFTVSRSSMGVTARQKVPLIAPVRPGDTITVSERWF